jgi:DNA-binding MarR family transcriptional regulator
MPRESYTEDVVYAFVCRHPGMSTYDISKKLGMTGGRVRHALSKLKEKGLVKFKFERRSARIRKLTYPVDAWSLLPKAAREELKRMVKQRLKV